MTETSVKDEIFNAGNDGDMILYRSKTIARLLYEVINVSVGETVTRRMMDDMHVLLECLRNEITAMEALHARMWKAAGRAAHPNETD